MEGQNPLVTRPPAVSGSFYPQHAAELRAVTRNLLSRASHDGPVPKVLIAPHAGYIYSGPVAATGYARLDGNADHIRRVVLIGPAHRVHFQGVALSTAAGFDTPLGSVGIDTQVVDELRRRDAVTNHDEAHRQEHCLEVHLPFLQQTLSDFSLVPVLVGDISATELTATLDSLWGGPETLIVVSTDLSHFLSYEQAVQLDGETTRAIEQTQPRLGPTEACGCRPLNAALELIRAKHLQIATLDVRNSGDTAGSRDRVVGYGTYVAS